MWVGDKHMICRYRTVGRVGQGQSAIVCRRPGRPLRWEGKCWAWQPAASPDPRAVDEVNRPRRWKRKRYNHQLAVAVAKLTSDSWRVVSHIWPLHFLTPLMHLGRSLCFLCAYIPYTLLPVYVEPSEYSLMTCRVIAALQIIVFSLEACSRQCVDSLTTSQPSSLASLNSLSRYGEIS